MYQKINIFDFDGTFFYTPEFWEGKKVWERKKGRVWPYNGWASKPESLDMDVFYIPMNPFVYKRYLESVNDKTSFTALVTGRLETLREQVEAIINANGLEFDMIALNPMKETYRFKTNLFTDLINEYNPEVITLYDDKYSHMVKWENQWAPLQKCRVEIINVMKSDKTPKIINN